MAPAGRSPCPSSPGCRSCSNNNAAVPRACDGRGMGTGARHQLQRLHRRVLQPPTPQSGPKRQRQKRGQLTFGQFQYPPQQTATARAARSGLTPSPNPPTNLAHQRRGIRHGGTTCQPGAILEAPSSRPPTPKSAKAVSAWLQPLRSPCGLPIAPPGVAGAEGHKIRLPQQRWSVCTGQPKRCRKAWAEASEATDRQLVALQQPCSNQGYQRLGHTAQANNTKAQLRIALMASPAPSRLGCRGSSSSSRAITPAADLHCWRW